MYTICLLNKLSVGVFFIPPRKEKSSFCFFYTHTHTLASEKQDVLLRSIYENVKHPDSFSSPYRLFKAARKEDKTISLANVKKWMEGQLTYTTHRQVMTKFPRRRIVVRGPEYQYQGDLMDFQSLARYNDGNRYLLTVIDCFSRFAAIVPLRRKEQTTVVEGMEKAFKFMGFPKKFQTDEGTEFHNGSAADFFAQHGIIHFSTKQEVKASMCERFNRTVRDKIKKYMTLNETLRYVDIIPDITQSYNSRPHPSLGHNLAPEEVDETNQKAVYKFMYGKYLAQKECTPSKFQVGDLVRLAAYRETFRHSNKMNFTKEVFPIAEVLKTHPPTYLVLDPDDNEIVEGAFYEEQLQKWEPR